MVEKEAILEALKKVEHPAIAATLVDLGMLRDLDCDESGKVSFILMLPFPNVPENVRNMLVGSLAAAAQGAGGEVTKASLAYMDEPERQHFLKVERENWRG